MSIKNYSKPLRLALAILFFVLSAVLCIQLLTLATGSSLPEGWMLSTGMLP
jgi:hypothetical protein